MPDLWYVLKSQLRKEDMLWHQVLEHGFESFYPRIRVHRVNPRSRKIQPYFPGYLFVRADLSVVGISTFQWMPYGSGLVTFGGEPAVVSDQLIQEINRRVIEINDAGGQIFDAVKSGEAIYIHSGPFSGYEAIFDARISGTERVRVLLKMLNQPRIVPVELQAGYIQPKKKTSMGWGGTS